MSTRQHTGKRKIRTVSFSGIDGAGKSTQIGLLRSRFEQMGLAVRVVAFWDDVATLTWMRENASHAIFKGDKGVGSPEAPIHRRDKNVRSPLLTCIRLCVYLLDAVSLYRVTRKTMRSDLDCVIFDRYIYDQFANLNLRNPIIRLYVRAIMLLVPRTDVSFLIDVEPSEARRRKPEYPIDFLIEARASYLIVNDLTGCFTVIPPMRPKEVHRQVFAYAAPDRAIEATLPEIGIDVLPNQEIG